MRTHKLIYSSAISAFINAVFVTFITVFAELNASTKNWLADFSGHHWVSKSIFSILLFVAALAVIYGASRGEMTSSRIKRSLNLAMGSVVVGSVIILLFYTGHHLGRW